MRTRSLSFLLALALLMPLARLSAQNTLKDRSLTTRAVDLYRAGKYSAAAHQFQRAKEALAPEDKPYEMSIDYYIAACAVKQGLDNSQALVDGFLLDYPQSIYATQSHVLLGDLYYSKEDYRSALAEYDKADPFELEPAMRPDYYFNKAYSLFMCDQTQEARLNFSLVQNDARYRSAATYYMAYIDYADGKYDLAYNGFSSLVDDEKFGPVVPFYILHIKYYQNDYRYVIDNGAKLINSSTGERQGEIARIVSESYFHTGNYKEAIRYMELYSNSGSRVLSRQENYMLGYSYYMTGNYRQAVDILTRIVQGDDQLTQNAYYHLADAALKSGDKTTALMAFGMASRSDFNPAIKEDAMFNYAKLQFDASGSTFDGAINTISAYMAAYPGSPRIGQMRSYLIAAYFNSKDYQAALDAINKQPVLNNEEKTALQKIAYFRALEYYMDGDYANALKYFDTSLANPFNSKYTGLSRYWKAETLVRQGRYADAIPLYKDYVAIAPQSEREYAMAYYGSGYCNFNLKRWGEAGAAFERFLALHKGSDNFTADANVRLGDIHFVNKEYWKSIESYDKAMTVPGSAADYAAFQRAVALGLVDRVPRKIEALNDIINKGTSEYADRAMFELGRTYILQDKYADGAAAMKKLTERYPKSPYYVGALTELGLVYQNMGRSDEALKYFKRVVSEYRNTPQARDAMAAIKNIYIDNNDVSGYYAYASQSGIETNVTVVEKDSLTYVAARRVYLAGNFSGASQSFENYLKEYPNGAYKADATFFRADALRSLGRTSDALPEYEKVSEMPYSQYTVPALEYASKQNLAVGNYRKAFQQYDKLIPLSTQPSALNDAYAGLFKSAQQSGDRELVSAAADRIIRDAAAPGSLKQEANAAKGKILYENHDPAQALPLLKTAATNAKTATGAESKYLVAKILFEQGHIEQAQKEIFSFSEQNSPHSDWLARAFILLGDTYLKQGDAFQAKATYQSVADGYTNKTDGIAQEAREKLNNIK